MHVCMNSTVVVVSDRQRKAEDAVLPRISSGRRARAVQLPDVPLDEQTAPVSAHEEDRGEPRAVVLWPVGRRVVRQAVVDAQRRDVDGVAELCSVPRRRVRLQPARCVEWNWRVHVGEEFAVS